jgi:hypothetical protein
LSHNPVSFPIKGLAWRGNRPHAIRHRQACPKPLIGSYYKDDRNTERCGPAHDRRPCRPHPPDAG